MTYTETDQFLEKVLKQLWSDWTPTDAESGVWGKNLARYEYATAKLAAEQCFADQTKNWKRPVLNTFLTKIKVSLQNHPPAKKDTTPMTNVYVRCLENEEYPNRVGTEHGIYVLKNQDDPDYVMRAAEITRQRCEGIYRGHWITVKKKPLEMGELRGAAAKKAAEELILAGPDTPGRRFLLANYKELVPTLSSVPENKEYDDDLPF